MKRSYPMLLVAFSVVLALPCVASAQGSGELEVIFNLPQGATEGPAIVGYQLGLQLLPGQQGVDWTGAVESSTNPAFASNNFFGINPSPPSPTDILQMFNYLNSGSEAILDGEGLGIAQFDFTSGLAGQTFTVNVIEGQDSVLVDENAGTVDFQWTAGSISFDTEGRLDTVVPVVVDVAPEPSCLALLVFGSAALLARRRRARN